MRMRAHRFGSEAIIGEVQGLVSQPSLFSCVLHCDESHRVQLARLLRLLISL